MVTFIHVFLLDFGINSILFQRGIYPPEDFKIVENFGLPIYMSQNNKIKNFLSTTLNQLKGLQMLSFYKDAIVVFLSYFRLDD